MVIGLGRKQERLKRAPDSALAIDACLVIELANQGRKFTKHGEEGALRPYCRLMVGLAVLQEPPYALTHHWMQCGQNMLTNTDSRINMKTHTTKALSPI